MGGPADWFCHGEPWRCFAPGGLTMALCARCVGMHVGFVAGVVAARAGHGGRGGLALAALAIAQMVALGLAGRPDAASLRAASGFAFGVAIGWLANPRFGCGPRGQGALRRIVTPLVVGAAIVAALAVLPTPNWVAHALPVLGLGALVFAVVRAGSTRPRDRA